MNKSIWGNTNENTNITNKTLETDILIIGGGITGITSLLYLKDKNAILIEANKIGSGITNKTTGKINIMQEYNYQNIENSTNQETAIKYLEAQIYATNELKKIIKKYNIDFKTKFL